MQMRWLTFALTVNLALAANLARIDGTVTDASNGQPLRRVQVMLRPASAGLAAIGVETDDRGTFEVRDVEPGQYSVLAQRDGYLPAAIARFQGAALPAVFAVEPDEKMAGVEIRLTRWSTIGGRIRYDDAEPASGILVQAWREWIWRGQRRWYVAGSARTNDRGEYRLYGLSKGPHVIAAVYDRPSPVANLLEQARLDSSGLPVPVTGYVTTFYPASTRLPDAIAVTLGACDEASGIDMYLKLERKVTIRGRVIDGLTGQVVRSPAMTLERVGASSGGGVPVELKPTLDAGGVFTIRGIPAGRYVFICSAASGKSTVMARTTVTVAATDIEDLDIVLRPARTWQAILRSPFPRKEKEQWQLVLEPRSEGRPVVRALPKDGAHEFTLEPDTAYDVVVDNLPVDAYVSALRAGGTLVDRVDAAMAGDEPLIVEVAERGGRVDGAVSDGRNAVAGAYLMLIPENGLLRDYRSGVAGRNALFSIRGVAPGRYRLVAWTEEQPCDVWQPADCNGVPVDLSSASAANVIVPLRP